jgi:cyclopropane fatty-acyl-phospholipid synthase-like methyltransferase
MDKTLQAVSVFDTHAKAYQDKFMNVDLYSEALDLLCDSLKSPQSTILELACGPGNITKYLLDRKPDLKIFGTDLSVNMLELAKTNNPSATFQLMDCRDIHRIKDRYDGIVVGFCLPYLSKEEAWKLIHDASKILNPNGVLYLSTMEDDYSKSGLEASSSGNEIYMHYHQADYLMKYCIDEGFKVIHSGRKEYTDHNGKAVKDLMIVAVKR